ncbi:MAG: hypothetical protein NLN66_00675 [Candidatus Thalassarchaeaceae archaeon]|nr:hypothetical protein [Candidatus Thalassarchaeaceae archaeon]
MVSAENNCDVPASNTWDIRERTNQHDVDSWGWNDFDQSWDDVDQEITEPLVRDFSTEIYIENDSASAISMILTTGKSYTFCFSFENDLEAINNTQITSKNPKADVYLMTEQNWGIYKTSYELRFENWIDDIPLPVEYKDTLTWMPFRDVHAYEKVTNDYFSVSVDTTTMSWFDNRQTEYYLVFDNWDNDHTNDQKATVGNLNVELLVEVENRLMIPKFTAYILVAVLPLSCLIVPFIINSKYHSYGLEKTEIIEKEIVPILEQ